MTTNIFSWNVNGIRSATKKGLAEWLNETGDSIVGFQEVRANPDQIPKEVSALEGFHTHFNPATRPGYSGVAIYSKRPFEDAQTGIGSEEHDLEGRIQTLRFGGLSIVNGYFPNGQGKDRDNSRVPFKLEFYEILREQLSTRARQGEKILVMGDWNTAHKEIDIARPKANLKTSGFLPIEREAMDRWVEDGWTDTFRAFNAEPERYSWWSNRAGARERNVGWRIDYIFASPAAMEHIVSAEIHDQVLGSDHCPISVTVRNSIFDS